MSNFSHEFFLQFDKISTKCLRRSDASLTLSDKNMFVPLPYLSK